MFRLCIIVVSLGLWICSGAYAEIAIVDVDKIFSESTVIVDIKKQMELAKKKAEQEIDKLEQKARDQAGKLEKEKEKLSPRVYGDRQEAIQKQVVDWQELADKRKAQLDEAYGEAMEHVKNRVLKILEQVAMERKVGLVIPSQQVAYVNSELISDLSTSVMDRLNKEMPSYKVKLPKD